MYKVTVFVWEKEIVGKDTFSVRGYKTVKTGLTWNEAKEERKLNRSLQIVRM